MLPMSVKGLEKKQAVGFFLFSVIFRKVINLQVRDCVSFESHGEGCYLTLLGQKVQKSRRFGLECLQS